MVRSFRDLNALKLASIWCSERDFVQLRKVSKDWHRTFEHVPDEVVLQRIEQQHAGYFARMVAPHHPFPHMCLPASCQTCIASAPCWSSLWASWWRVLVCTQLVYLFTTSPVSSRGSLSTCCWRLRSSSCSVTCLLKHLWTSICVE